jgi:putative membrane protein
MRVTTENLAIAITTAGLALGASAQTRNPAPVPQDRGIVTAEASRESPPNNKNSEDVEFLVDAMRTGLAEVQLGELAAQRSYDPRVRDFGSKLASDHAAQVAEIERMLQPLQVAVPTEPSTKAQAQHAALARLTGEQFDAAFLEAMVASHTEAIEQYGAQTHANPDRTLSEFATKSLPVLREHLAQAESLR